MTLPAGALPPVDPKLVPPRPWVLALDYTGHYLRVTHLRDWGDGKGPVPLAGQGFVEFKQQKSGARRGTTAVWLGFKGEDVAIAHHIVRAVNAHEALVASLAACLRFIESREDGDGRLVCTDARLALSLARSTP